MKHDRIKVISLKDEAVAIFSLLSVKSHGKTKTINVLFTLSVFSYFKILIKILLGEKD